MLDRTKYEAFIQKYPTAQKLARAPLGDVLRMWQGLGYNRRAKYLLECAKVVTADLQSVFPDNEIDLQKLPGIGPYTASAICAFAYNQPVTLIETNVRQVFIHHFFKTKEVVTDAEILTLVEKTLPQDNARAWYSALMDYGTYLKAEYGNNTQKTKEYKKQTKFKGSDREVRAAIVRILSSRSATFKELCSALQEYDQNKIEPQLQSLLKEALVIQEKNNRYRLP